MFAKLKRSQNREGLKTCNNSAASVSLASCKGAYLHLLARKDTEPHRTQQLIIIRDAARRDAARSETRAAWLEQHNGRFNGCLNGPPPVKIETPHMRDLKGRI